MSDPADTDAAEEAQTSRDFRTRVQTLMGLAGAAALVVVLGAVSVRDTTLATQARVSSLEARLSALEGAGRARDTDDRGTREVLVRLTTTVDAMRGELTEVRGAVLRDRTAMPRR